MTYQPAQPGYPGQPAQQGNANNVAAGGAADARTFLAATLLTFASGMLVLIGYGLIGGFGVVLGLIAAGCGFLWWSNMHGKVFPSVLPTKSVVGVGVVAAVLFFIVWVMS